MKRMLGTILFALIITAVFLNPALLNVQALTSSQNFNVVASSDDGRVYGSNTVYATARSSATGYSNTTALTRCGQMKLGITYTVNRAFFRINTTNCPINSTITSALVYFKYYWSGSQTLTSANFTMSIVNWTDSVPIDTSDYNSYDSSVVYGGFDTSTLSGASGWYNFTITNTSIVTKGGYTNIALLSSRDISATPPGANLAEYVELYTYDNSPSDALYFNLTYTYTIPEPSSAFNATSTKTLYNSSTTYNTAWTAFTGSEYGTIRVGQENNSGTYTIYRTYLLFNTSSYRGQKYFNVTLHALVTAIVGNTTLQIYSAKLANNPFESLCPHNPIADYDYYYYGGLNLMTACGSLNLTGSTVNEWKNITFTVDRTINDSMSRFVLKAQQDGYQTNTAYMNFDHIMLSFVPDYNRLETLTPNGTQGTGDWSCYGTSPYLSVEPGIFTNYMFCSGNAKVSRNFTFSPSHWAYNWIENITFTYRIWTATYGDKINVSQLLGTTWYNYTLNPASASLTIVSVSYVSNSTYDFMMPSNSQIKVLFTSWGTGSFYVDWASVTLTTWRPIDRIHYYTEQKIDWATDTTTKYLGLSLSATDVSDMEAYIDYLASTSDWLNVMRWTGRCMKLGVERESAIKSALGNMSKAGQLPDTVGGSFSVYERDLLYATYYYAEKYGYTSAWNKTAAFVFFRDAIAVNGSGQKAVYQINADGSVALGLNRYYDENAQTASCYLIFNLLNVTGALNEAGKVWQYVDTYYWHEVEQYFDYAPGANRYECEAGFFLKVFSMLYYYNASVVNITKVFTDTQIRFLNQEWNSPQWLYYAVRHAAGSAPNNEIRLHNTFGAWSSLISEYPLMNSTYNQHVQNLLLGSSTLAGAWVLLHNILANLYSYTTQYWKMSSSTGITTAATAVATNLFFMLNIVPLTTTLAFPLEELHYEYYYDLDPSIFKINVSGRTLRIPISSAGAVQINLGGNNLTATFGSEGLYDIVFSEQWNNITSNTYVSSLPAGKICLSVMLATGIGVDGVHETNQTNTFRTQWQSSVAPLDKALFYWNASGSMTYNGSVTLFGASAWSNFSRILPESGTSYVIAWYITANNTNGNTATLPTQTVEIIKVIYVYTVSLVTPSDEFTTENSSLTFTFHPVFTTSISNASLWINVSGTWQWISWNTSAIINASDNSIYYNLSSYGPGTYVWNVRIYNSTTYTTAETNYTLHIIPGTMTGIIVSLLDPNNATTSFTGGIIFNYTTTIYGDNFYGASLWTNLSGTWQSVATNTSAILNGTINSLSYTLTNGTYLWNVRVSNSTDNIFAVSNRTLTIALYTGTLIVSLNDPADSTELTTFTIVFNYTTTIYYDNFQNASLWFNLVGFWYEMAANTTAIQNGTLNSISYTFSSNTMCYWNIKVYNSTNGIMAESSRALTVWIPSQYITVSLSLPNDLETITTNLVTFQYIPIAYWSTFHNASLFLNVSGVWQAVAYNSSVLVNATTNSISYFFTASGTYEWNIRVWNSTSYVLAVVSRSLTISLPVGSLTVTLDEPESETVFSVNTVIFNYTTAIYYDNFVNACLYINLTGLQIEQAAWNTTVILNGTKNSISYTFAVSGAYVWNVRVYNSTGGYFAETGWFVTIESVPPQYDNSTISFTPIHAGDTSILSCHFTDNYHLKNYTFSFKNGVEASWVNTSGSLYGGIEAWISCTEILSVTIDDLIQFRWICYDTANNVNSTQILNFTTLTPLSRYFFYFEWKDLDNNIVSAFVTWQLYNGTQLLNYAEGEVTLIEGPYALKTYRHGYQIDAQTLDTAAVGNTTVSIPLWMKKHMTVQNGYITIIRTMAADDAYVLVSETAWNLTFTVAGTVLYATFIVDTPQNATYVTFNGDMNITSWTYDSVENPYIFFNYINMTPMSSCQMAFGEMPPATLEAPYFVTVVALVIIVAGVYYFFRKAKKTEGIET